MKNYRLNLQYWVIILVTVILVFLFNASLTFAQSTPNFFKNGQIIDTVYCVKDLSQRYALYLPTYYDESKEWPIIYILEPGARAKMPLDSLKKTAEQYGYILASSYNSHNGPWGEMFEANKFMAEDVETRFSVNQDRKYLCGFSGGSRGAMAIAVLSGNVKGVIGCGAGFPDLKEYCPTSESAFVYYGLVGNADMNYLEMLEMEGYFKKIGMISQIQTFNAGHIWPSQELLNDAVEWLELQAMNKKIIEPDTAFINNQFQKCTSVGRQLFNESKLTETVKIYNYIIDDFTSYFDVSGFQQEIEKIEQTKAYLKEQSEWGKFRNEENRLIDSYQTAISQIRFEGNLADSNLIWWGNQISYLHRLEKNKNENKRLMASRLISSLTNSFVQNGSDFLSIKQYKEAALQFKLWTIISPENRGAHYNLARAYALSGQKRNAIESLEMAVKLGFQRLELLKEDSAFDSIREEKKFILLVSNLNE
ncbi:MAG: hypothetical protein CVU00_11230 [Bacteroidetes bacterium HGW-Bacteroidetes-17]|jgi:tetratricopeptide (TPR) repeat protein|nr:MAG: hypothetical protein CVU00_11230 [Bacteroidetes bacterium HGW-Bacteroidetes-17]